MRTELTVAIVLLTLASPALATPDSVQRDPAIAGSTPTEADKYSPTLTGVWRANVDSMRLTSDFDRSVWGENAVSTRMTELRVDASGSATLSVTRSVVDSGGQTIPASTSIEEVRLTIGDARPGAATRMEHDVKVMSAERRYPDEPQSSWPLDGVGVKVVTFTDGDGDTLEVRFDTPDGRGSFWELLHRGDRTTSSRARR